MKNRSKMILGLASLLGVTAGATAVSGFAWFVTTKTADVDVTKIGVYNNNPSLSVNIDNLKGVKRTNNAANDFNLEAANDTTSFFETAAGDGSKTAFVLTGTPLSAPVAYVDGVLAATTYDSGTNTVTFTGEAPANGKEIRFVYCDNAALTDISSIDAHNFYNPIWQVANEGTKATLIDNAVAGRQYISFDLTFVKPTTGSLKIFLDRPTITANNESLDQDKAARDVARVGFYTNTTSLILSNKADVAEYQSGISQDLVEDYDNTGVNANTTDGDYEIAEVTDNAVNLVKPSLENYSIRSSAPNATPANMYIGEVTSAADLTVHVSIWLEGTSAVDGNGNYSTPIGGEINVDLPIVAFGA